MSEVRSRPERNRKPGLAYAFTGEGVELPVLDVTHPEFEVVITDAEIASRDAQHRELERKRARMPAFLRRLIFRFYARKSVLLQGMAQASGGFLSGMNTYLLKLGANNLGDAYAGKLDRFVAGSFPATIIRLRTQNTARFLASGLRDRLRAAPSAPLHLVNIAGGPAADSLNALIILRREDPGLLEGRSIRIHVLDLEKEAPEFGKRALESVRKDGAALAGLDVSLSHIAYDWGNPSRLRTVLDTIGTEECVAAASTEGGLFEYGSDEDILSNLAVLRDHSPPGLFIVGSVTRDDEGNRLMHTVNSIRIIPRGLPVFSALVQKAGWKVETAIERPFSDVVRLVRER